jgi:hypothetical protein
MSEQILSMVILACRVINDEYRKDFGVRKEAASE